MAELESKLSPQQQHRETISNLSKEELYNNIKEVMDNLEILEFENSMFEQFLTRVVGHVDLPELSEEDAYTQLYSYEPNSTGLADVAFAVLNKGNAAPSQSSKMSKNTSISSSNPTSTQPTTARLTAEQKCDIAGREIEEINTHIETARNENERILDNYRASIEEMDLKQKDVNKAHTDFERDMKNSINERTKKYQADKVQRYFDEKIRAKEALIKKLRLKTATMGVLKKKVSMQLKQKEEMGEVLHEVDFNQLKIENQQYLEKIDDKNQELLDLKLKATNTTVYLNGKKRQMQELTENISTTNNEIKVRSETLKRLCEEMVRVKEEESEAKKQLQKLNTKIEDYKVPPTRDYILQKSKLDELRAKAKTWMRKVEIADMKLKSVRNNWSVICSKQNFSKSHGDSNSQMLSNRGSDKKSSV